MLDMIKIIKKLVLVILAVLVVLCGLDLYKSKKILEAKTASSVSELNNIEVDSVQLSESDYLKDFEFLWEVISDGMPVIEDYKKAYNYDFCDNYDRYYQSILSVEDDYEFLCNIKSVLNDIPSFHTGFLFEDCEEIFYNSSYMSDTLKSDNKLFGTLKIWNEKCCEKSEYYVQTYSSVVFCYVNGEYVFSSVFSDADTYNYSGYKLKSIDGNDVEKFIKMTNSAYKLNFDFNKNKFYRSYIIFNNGIGDKKQITLIDDDGKELNLSISYDLIYEYSKAYNSSYVNEKTEYENYIIQEIDDNILYCQIDNFSNNDGRDLLKSLREYCFSENKEIILDLRNNTGGNVEYALNYIVPVLYSEQFKQINTSWLYKSSAVKELYNVFSFQGIGNKKIYELEKCKSSLGYSQFTNGFYEHSMERVYKGLNPYSPGVCILVSHYTGSAADDFVSSASKFSQTTVIGENTGGEKYGGQAIKCLPKSKLVFEFFPEVYFNEDGANNSVYGTPPDIYSVLTYEGFMKREKMINDNIDVYSIENRLLWDDTLNIALELIKEK